MFEKINDEHHGGAFAALMEHYITLDAVDRREFEALLKDSLGPFFLDWQSWRHRQEA